MVKEELLATGAVARAAGIHRKKLTLSDVDKRRTQLWTASLFVVTAVTCAVAALLIAGDLLPEPLRFETHISSRILVVLGVGLGLAFVIYVVEKERHLRRLSMLLVEERVRSAGLSNRLFELSSLAEVAKTMNTTLDLEEVFSTILSASLELLGAHDGSIMLLSDDRRYLDVVSHNGSFSAENIPSRVPMGEGLAGVVAQRQEPSIGEMGNALCRADVHSSMCVPLQRRGELLGVLILNETEGAREFTEGDLRALELFAEHAAIAIGNARRFEEERETITRLEELDRLKSDFVATVSHELKTPLTAIIGAAKTVMRKGRKLPPEMHDSLLEMIERQGNRLLRLVDDVLTASRIESGIPKLRRERINMHQLASTVLDDLSHTRMGNEHPIALMTDPEFPHVWGDPVALQQVLLNLIENAVKYSEPGSKVMVDIKENGAEVVIEVIDEGHGIPPEQLEMIFDRFRQVDSSTTRSVGGFGLGLYIVKNLVEAHRGSVDVESKLDVGTTFRVHLPKRASDRRLTNLEDEE